MSKLNIIRAWKDAEYRSSLSNEEQKQLPENPAGQIELSMDELDRVAGAGSYSMLTAGCCNPSWYYTFLTMGDCTAGSCSTND